MLGLECDAAKARAEAADDSADVASLQAALKAQQHPPDCASATASGAHVFKDWRNGLGAQISSLVGAWATLMAKNAAVDGSGRVFPARRGSREAAGGTAAAGAASPHLLIPLGGLRYANKARCPKRDLSCYFVPFGSCEAPEGAKNARAKKTPPELAAQISRELKLRRPRDKWWLRKELTRCASSVTPILHTGSVTRRADERCAARRSSPLLTKRAV